MTAWACEFGTIVNDRELVLHLDQVLKYHEKAAALDFYWLTETLGIVPDAIYMSFALPGNEDFVDTLYRQLYEHQRGSYSSHEIDPSTGEPKSVRMRSPDEIANHQDRLFHLGLLAGSTLWYTWSLPGGDLYLPLEDLGLQHLATTSKQTGRKAKCYEFMVAFPAPTEMVDEIERRAKALVKAIEAGQEREQEETSRILALQKLRNLLDLQSRHWIAKGEVDHVLEINALGELDDAVRHLIDNAMARLSARVGESEAADALLECFDADGKGAELKACLDTIADHQNAYSSEFIARLNDVLVSAVHVLGQSSRAGDFLRDHWMLLFADACEHEPRLATTMIEELADSDLSAFWAGGWREDVAKVREVLGSPKRSSALKPIVRQTRASKAAMGLVSAAVSDVGIVALLYRIEKVSRAMMTRPAYRALARAMLRFMAGQAMEHHLIQGPVVGTRGTLKEFIEDIRGLKGKTGAAWLDHGATFNRKYDFSGRFRRFAPGIGLNVIAAYVSLCYAWDDEEELLVIRALTFTHGLVSVAGAGVALGEAIRVGLAKGVLSEVPVNQIKELGRKLTLAGAILSLVASGFAVYRDLGRSDHYGVFLNVVSFAAGTVTFAGAFLAVIQHVALAGLVSGVGVVLGGVVLVLALLDPGDGPVELAEAYLRYSKEGWPVAGDPQLAAVDSALARALALGAFQSMHPDVGLRGKKLRPGVRPTLHHAYELGFEVQELRRMFRSPEIALAIAKLEEADYSRPISKGQP